MSIFNKPAYAITKEDIQELKDNDEAESKILDYKLQVNKQNDGDKGDFLEDICAFANAEGGFIVVGIEDRKEDGKATGKPGRIMPLPVNSDLEKRRLDQMILDNTEQKVQTHIQPVEMEDGKYVFVVRIPKSSAAPHAVKSDKARIFWMRHNGGKHPMDVFELRSAFQRSGAALYQAREFRNHRLQQLYSGRILIDPITMNGPHTALHIIPAGAFETSTLLDLSLLDDRKEQNHKLIDLLRFTKGTLQPSFNFDGWLGRVIMQLDLRPSSIRTSYVQLFRNGCLEGLSNGLISSEPKMFLGELFEENLLTILKRLIEALKIMDVVPPLFIAVSIIGIHDFSFGYHGNYQGKFKTDPLEFPEVSLNAFDEELSDVMKPIFDTLANAAGFPYSESYIQQPATGRWRHISQIK
ncbi:MAG: ATP-binding protein [Chloroflexota bacterium]